MKNSLKKGGERKQSEAGQRKRSGAGSKGYCICSECAEKIEHQRGVPCNTIKCPKCGANMYRE